MLFEASSTRCLGRVLARLALAFVTLGSGPDFPRFRAGEAVELHLTAEALLWGCHLPETAQDLLEAVQAHGVSVVKIATSSDSLGEEWQPFWQDLDELVSSNFDIILEIQ